MDKYPHQNYSLQDMKGEIWKPVKGYEVYYMVSNLGRVKRLETFSAAYAYAGRGKVARRILPEKIARQKVKYRLNKHINEIRCGGIGMWLLIEGVSTHVHVSRLVYEAFIGKIPERGIVQHKDDDPQNNRVENLYLSTRSSLTYKLKKQGLSNLLYSSIGIKHSPERIARHIASHSKEVNQYDLQGNWIATYKSFKEAEEKTNAHRTNISQVLSGVLHRAGGFVWRTEKKDWIDLSEVRQKIFLSCGNNRRPVCQYTANGRLVATYRSMSEASRALGISLYIIYKSIKNKSVVKIKQTGYIWRYQEKTGSNEENPE